MVNEKEIISNINQIVRECEDYNEEYGTRIYTSEYLLDFIYAKTTFKSIYSSEFIMILFRHINDKNTLAKTFDYLFSIRTENGIIRPYLSSVNYYHFDGRISKLQTIEKMFLSDIKKLGFTGLVSLPNSNPQYVYVNCEPSFSSLVEYRDLIVKVIHSLFDGFYYFHLQEIPNIFGYKLITQDIEIIVTPYNGGYNEVTLKGYLKARLQ